MSTPRGLRGVPLRLSLSPISSIQPPALHLPRCHHRHSRPRSGISQPFFGPSSKALVTFPKSIGDLPQNCSGGPANGPSGGFWAVFLGRWSSDWTTWRGDKMKGWCEEDGNAVRGVEGWTWDRIWGPKRGLRSRGEHLRTHYMGKVSRVNGEGPISCA